MCQKRTDSQKPLSGACANVQGQATAQLQLSNQSPVMCQLGISVMRISKPKSPIVLKKIPTSFDHLVGERQKIYRQLNACGLCGLEVDDELVVCRLLERQISRPRASKDACGEAGSAFHAFV